MAMLIHNPSRLIPISCLNCLSGDPTAATFPALLQKFHHALYQHNIECEGSTILCRAASQGCVSLMETLLDKHHADVNAVHQGSTPLIIAVMIGSLVAVEQVLSRKELDLNHLNQGNRALWCSAAQKKTRRLPSGCFANRG